MLGLAAVCAGLAASSVDRYADDVAAQVGPLQQVVVARARSAARDPGDCRRSRAPLWSNAGSRCASRPRGRCSCAAEAVGYRTLVVARGRRLRRRGAARHGRVARPGAERRCAAGAWWRWRSQGRRRSRDALRPGALVDVLVTTDGDSGPPRTYLALQRLQLVDFRDSSGGERAGRRGRAPPPCARPCARPRP